MSGTVPTTPPPTCTITAAGITIPTYQDCYNWLVTQFQAIYGADIYLGNDSQDGQLIGILATAMNDQNSATANVFYSFSPATAQGAGLSSLVKINGMTREVPTNSTIPAVIVGVAGTPITNGNAVDPQDNTWNLPASVEIPSTGSITVTLTAATAGAITLSSGVSLLIGTPTRGWQSITTSGSATAGNPVETDAQLKIRQTQSTSPASQTVLAGLIGVLEQLPGVTAVAAFENNTNVTDANGIAGHTIALVVTGGTVQSIINAIGLNKSIGCGVQGNVSGTYVDVYGRPQTIYYYTPITRNVTVQITLNPLPGYTSVIGQEIQAAVSAYINALPSGALLSINKIGVPANLYGPYAAPANPTDTNTYEIQPAGIAIGIDGFAPALNDIQLAFNDTASCPPANVTLVVT